MDLTNSADDAPSRGKSTAKRHRSLSIANRVALHEDNAAVQKKRQKGISNLTVAHAAAVAARALARSEMRTIMQVKAALPSVHELRKDIAEE